MLREKCSVWDRRIGSILLLIALAGGAAVRLGGLDRRSISHPEMYVPGIRLPEGTSEPAERTTIRRIMTGTFSSDTHPPGYYLFMFPWTRVAGTSLTAMRLPSAILGTASIALLYGLGAAVASPITGGVAAVLLAFNGHHVFWSQVARMYALGCFLALLATILLVKITRIPRPKPVLLAAYAALLLAGLATHVFLWTLLAVHMLWTFGNAVGRRQLPDVCRTQLLTLVLGSPLAAFAAYQSGTTVAVLSRAAGHFAWDFLPFAFLLPDSLTGYFPAAVPFDGAAGTFARVALGVLAAALFGLGVRRLWRDDGIPAPDEKGGRRSAFWIWAWAGAGILGVLEVLVFIRMTRWLPPEQIHATLALTRRMAIVPPALAITSMALDRWWPRLPRMGWWNRLVKGEARLMILLAVVPAGLVALASEFRPLLNERGMLFTAPYLLLLLAAGMERMIAKRAWPAVALGAVMAVALGCSVFAYKDMRVDPGDYKEFAGALHSAIRPQDMVFVHRVWYATPMIYYLAGHWSHLWGEGFGEAVQEYPDARFWVVLLYEKSPTPEMLRALAGRRVVQTIESPPYGTALLYER